MVTRLNIRKIFTYFFILIIFLFSLELVVRFLQKKDLIYNPSSSIEYWKLWNDSSKYLWINPAGKRFQFHSVLNGYYLNPIQNKIIVPEKDRAFVSMQAITYDSLLGWKSTPNYNSATNAGGLKAGSYTHDNNSFRIDSNNNFNEKKILVVGSSFLYGFQVANDDTITANMNLILNEKYQVINAAVPGYDDKQSYLNLLSLVDRIKPLIVIFGHNFRSPIKNTFNFRDFAVPKTSINHLEFHENIEKVDHPYDYWSSKVLTFKYYLRSELIQLMHNKIYTAFTSDIYLNNWRLKKGLDDTSKILKELKRLSKDKNFKLLVLGIPRGKDFEKEIDLGFNNICLNLKISCLNLKDKFQETGISTEEIYFTRNSKNTILYHHFSKKGNNLAAEIIEKYLNEL